MTMYAWREKVSRFLSRMLLLDKGEVKEESEHWIEGKIEGSRKDSGHEEERRMIETNKHLKGASPQNTLLGE